ncbi:MAG: HIT family protein [Bacteroidales bacterium]|nr:HIT family protein [Bacteroidota bacterium]MBL6950749.1 HIT family protein [Bacteroidales bacterium]
MPGIFSRIIDEEIPCYKVAEDERFLAFLDINPLAIGHALVIPKKEIDYIFDIPDDLYKDYFCFAKSVALAIENVIPCQRIGIAVVGLEVPHAHIHLIPLQTIYDIDFKKPKLKLSEMEFHRIAEKISSSFEKIVST